MHLRQSQTPKNRPAETSPAAAALPTADQWSRGRLVLFPSKRRSLIRKHHHALAGTAHHHLVGPRSPWWERFILWLGHSALWPTRIHPAHLVPVLVHDLELAGIAAVSLTLTIVAIVVARRVAIAGPVAPASAAGRRRFELLLPDSFVRDGLNGFFRTLSLLLRPVLVGGQPSVSFTFTAIGERLGITLECDAEVVPSVVANLEAAIDGVSLEEIPTTADEASKRRWAWCTLRPSGSQWLPLESKHKVDPARFVLAALRSESESEWACIQIAFSPLSRRARRRGRREPRRLRTGRRGGMLVGTSRFGLEVVRDGAEIFLPGGSPSTQTARPAYTPDQWTLKQAGAIEEKTAEPLLAVTIRLAVSGGARSSKRWRLRALAASFAQFHALGGLRAGRELFGRRRFGQRLPARRPPLAVTASEAAALLPLPTNLAETRLQVGEAPARRLRPAADAPAFGIRLGRAER